MDDDVLRKAQKYADERYPLGEYTPAAAAARTGLLTLLLLVFFAKLEYWLGFPIAISVATAIATAVIWFDTNQRWANHARAEREAVQRLERDRTH